MVYTIDITEKQITALFNDNVKIIARITSNSVRLESLAEVPELMKTFERMKKELEEENIASSQVLSALEPIMHIHSCTVELYPDSVMDRKYDNISNKLINRIAQNKTIIMLR